MAARRRRPRRNSTKGTASWPWSGYHGAVLKCDGARPARSAGPRLGVAGRRAGELDHVGHSNNCSLWLARGGWLRKRAVGQCQVRRATAGDRAALIAAGRHVTLSPATLHTTNICDNNQCAQRRRACSPLGAFVRERDHKSSQLSGLTELKSLCRPGRAAGEET